ncbi:Rap1a/Tai family immunity protein [Methylorubrum populi]|uniref:Rap1a immunity protein domain-containing protein n=1 Tax=Methylorubrum populi TaxID=223967 RepID=A0A833MUG2_9HYPH|nr:Rap1a/Tai family immunity protein [Methylorubrum populi]KAB7782172.1 hypothetical protein F8B43_4927 [Methylorubrum populi]
MLRWLLVALTLIAVAPAVAQVRAGEIAVAAEGTEAWTYLRGLKDGIEWAVAQSRFDKEPPPFCPPPNLAIAAEQYRQILSDQIRRHPEQARHFAGLVMMDALKRTFPCSSKP